MHVKLPEFKHLPLTTHFLSAVTISKKTGAFFTSTNHIARSERCVLPPPEAVLMSRIKLDSLVEPEIKDWIKMIYRRLSSRMRARNPWVIEFRRDLQEIIFFGIKEAVRKGLSSYGVSVTEDNREDIVLFSNKNRLLRDLSLLSGMSRNEILLQFNKVMRGVRKGKAEVTVSEEKPFCIRYCKRKHQCCSMSF